MKEKTIDKLRKYGAFPGTSLLYSFIAYKTGGIKGGIDNSIGYILHSKSYWPAFSRPLEFNLENFTFRFCEGLMIFGGLLEGAYKPHWIYKLGLLINITPDIYNMAINSQMKHSLYNIVVKGVIYLASRSIGYLLKNIREKSRSRKIN